MKQKRFVQEIINNPKQSATEAAEKSYQVKNRNVARSIATENLSKPAVQAVLVKHDLEAQKVLGQALKATKKQFGFNPDTKSMELLSEDEDHAIRVRAADSILDRLHGKATQQVQVQSQHVVLTLDLTAEKE